jgi:transcriptional regulator with XRE-family HTH domain
VGTAAYDALAALMVSLRLEAGLTQEELASRVGRHFTWVSKIERGTRRLDLVEMFEVAEAIGIDPVDVVGRFKGLLK